MTEAVALHNLGETYRATGRLDEAADCFGQALAVRQRIGDRHGEAQTLREHGDLLRETGQLADARRNWQLALAIFSEFGSSEAADLRRRLDSAAVG